MHKKEDYRIYFISGDDEMLATRVLGILDLDELFPGSVEVSSLCGASTHEWDMFRMLNPGINISTIRIGLDAWVNYCLRLRDSNYWIDRTGGIR